MRLAPLPRARLPRGLAWAYILVVGVVLAGCGASPTPPSDPEPTPTAPTITQPTVTPTEPQPTAEPTVTVPTELPTLTPLPPTRGLGGEGEEMTGTIGAGVEAGCLIFTDDLSGNVYEVSSGELDGFGDGDRVTVTGQVETDVMTTCQQGPVLTIEQIEPAPAD